MTEAEHRLGDFQFLETKMDIIDSIFNFNKPCKAIGYILEVNETFEDMFNKFLWYFEIEGKIITITQCTPCSYLHNYTFEVYGPRSDVKKFNDKLRMLFLGVKEFNYKILD